MWRRRRILFCPRVARTAVRYWHSYFPVSVSHLILGPQNFSISVSAPISKEEISHVPHVSDRARTRVEAPRSRPQIFSRAKKEFFRHNQDRHTIATAADPGGEVNPRRRADGRSTHGRACAGHHRVRLQSWSDPAWGSNSQSGDVNRSNRKARFF